MQYFNCEMKKSKWLDNGVEYVTFGEITTGINPPIPIMLTDPLLDTNTCRLYCVETGENILGVIGLEYICSEDGKWSHDTEVSVVFTGVITGKKVRYLEFGPFEEGCVEYPNLEFIQKSMEALRLKIGE